MRLYAHYRFRAFAHQARKEGPRPQKLLLSDDDSWLSRCYRPGSEKYHERKLFA